MTNKAQLQDSHSLLAQNRLLTQEIQRRVNQLSAINTVAATVSQSLDLDLTLQTALDAVLSIINVEAAGISLVDEEQEKLVLRAQRGLKLDFVSEPMRIPLGEGLSGQVVTEDRAIVIDDLTGEPNLAVPAFGQERIRALAMAPMHARGRVIGVLSVMSHGEYSFSDEEIDVLKAIADQVGVALDNARLYEESRAQQRQLSTVIHSVADAIIATDSSGRISLLNHAARQLFELKARKIEGVPLHEAPLHPRLRDALRRAMQRAGDAPTVFDVTLENGRMLTAVVSRLRASSQVEQGDTSEGWVVVLQDVSHFKRAEQLRMEFVRTAAHDLRNPLGVTLSALMMLRDYLPAEENIDEILQIALEAVNRMQELLDNLFNLETIESGSDFDPKPMNPMSILTEALREVEPAMQAKAQTCRLDVPRSLPAVKVDPKWFQRALVNYLSNACKYTPQGGHIVLCVRQEGSELLFEVVDDGPGIPLEFQSRLFERFYRPPSTRDDIKGSGLGLAIVKSIVEAHGGRVYLHSRPGQGSTFGIALPLPA